LREVLDDQSAVQSESSARMLAHADTKTEKAVLRLEGEIALVRKDMDAMEQRSQARFTLLQWMLGILIAGVASLVLKAYF